MHTWSAGNIITLKVTPWVFTHFSQRCHHCWKLSEKSSFGMVFSSAVVAVIMSSHVWNRFLFNGLEFGEQPEVAGSHIRRVRSLVFCQKSLNQVWGMWSIVVTWPLLTTTCSGMQETAVWCQNLSLRNRNSHISLTIAICAQSAMFGLFFNTPRKSMGFQGKEHMRTKIVINGKIIEQVRDFNYLGWNIFYCERKEVNNKLNKFQRMCGIIRRTLKGKTQLSTKIKFYKVMAVSILMYDSENWSLNRSDKRKIEAAEMKFLRPTTGYTLLDKK